LLSSISKILEKIVAKKLVDHLLDNDLLYVHQYGFLPNRSTEQNLFQIVNYITQALNEGNYCIGVFLDLRKAFDVCSHEILLKKLEKMGIRGSALIWFANYLSGRSQFVDIDGERSDALNIDISVIQGSILGPILFLCYINDFYAATSLFSVLFADDTTGLGKGKNLRDLTAYMNIELQKIANWFRSNKMAINTSKTKFIVFRTRGKRIVPADCNLVFNNNEIGKPENPNLLYPIDRVHYDGEEKTFKLLGGLFDEYLSFDDHISNLCGKISKSLYCMNRVKNFITQDALKMLYFSMVHSHLSYCINIYGSANVTSLNRLKLKQKAAIRIVCNAGHRDHTNPLFKRLGILPLNELIQYSNLKFMHNFWHKKLPLSFHDLWTTNRARNPNLVLRNANNLYIPAHMYATLKRLPLFSFPKIWNDDSNLKENPSLRAYLKSVKSALLNSIVI
jgi:phage antirepressor YoqD-like protein